MDATLPSLQGYNILIVDDEEDILNLLELSFVDASFQVFLARNGLEAMERILKLKIDCVITDIRMPKCDGVELLSRIKELGPRAPIIFTMTGASEAKELDLVALGAIQRFEKPVKVQDLIQAIRGALSQSIRKT